MTKHHTERVVGALLAALALGVYLATLSDGASPGASAAVLAMQLGLSPAVSPSQPLYAAAARLLVALTGEHAVLALNAFSAGCAALAVWLLYGLVLHAVRMLVEDFLENEPLRRAAALAAGALSAGFLAFSIPFWSIANRAHYAAFDVLLLLTLARLLVAYAVGGGGLPALVLAFGYGAAMAQFATLLILAPVFAAGMIVAMWRRDALHGWLLPTLVAMVPIGALTYVIAAWAFSGSVGYEIRGYTSFSQVLWHMWRDQYLLIMRSLPRAGWLIVLFVTVVPWLTVFAVARRGLNDEHDWGGYALHALMTALVLAVSWNTPLAPWAMLGWRRLLVTPYVLNAMVAGYLGAYWLLLAIGRETPGVRPVLGMIRRISGVTLLLILVATAGATAVRNAAEANPHDAAQVREVASHVMDCLDGRDWLITDGRLDHHLLIEAWRRKRPLRVLNVAAGNNPLYLDYVATWFDDPRMKNLVGLGLSAFLREWLSPSADRARNVAVLGIPDFWMRYGYVAIPDRLVFISGDPEDLAPAGIRAHMPKQKAFWSSLTDWLETADPDAGTDGSWCAWIRGQSGRVANNLGVLLEDVKDVVEAANAYRMARRLDPSNVSALLNLATMVRDGRTEDPDGAVANALKRIETGLDRKYHIWTLSRHYGTVRTPEAFAQLGWTWVHSGRPGLAIVQLERAEQLLPDEQKTIIRGMMADFYRMDNRPLESEAIYRSILLENPDHLGALQGMMRLAMEGRDDTAAASFLDRAAAAGLDPVRVTLYRAWMETAAGEFQQARERLETLLQENRRLLPGWTLLAEIGFSADDPRLVEQAVQRLDALEGQQGIHGSVIRGRQAFEAGNLPAAADFFEMALARQPGNRRLVETLLRLDLTLARRDSIRAHVKTLLQQDPGHSLALYVRGSLQLADGDILMAEQSFRESLRRRRLPMALNDLAWLLAAKGVFDEAEALVNETLTLNERQPAAWDTKGIILLRTGRVEDAVEAFTRAIGYDGANPVLQLHMAEARLALGNRDAVREILDTLNPLRDQFPPREREMYNRLRESVR